MTDFTLLDFSEDENLQRQKIDSVQFLQFQREKTALKYFLIGRGYSKALKALGFAERRHANDMRKDGVTPGFHHQVRIALMITQLPGVIDEELCIIAALLHDIQEDHGVHYDQIASEFGEAVAKIIWRLTKKFAGSHKNKEEYIKDIAMCYVASIVKGCDRLDNMFTMVGVFTAIKMAQYAKEAETVFLKMLKVASKLYPEQQQAYQTIIMQMKRQITTTEQYVEQVEIQVNQERLIGELNLQLVKAAEATKQANEIRDNTRSVYRELEVAHIDLSNKMDMLSNAETVKDPSAKIEAYSMIFRTLLGSGYKTGAERTDIVQAMSEVANILGISTLEMQEFRPDTLSEGTTVV